MIIVIQCAASKQADAGHLVSAGGKLIDFVARPQIAPRCPDRMYARPDDQREDGIVWRQVLWNYNTNPDDNPLRLYPAYRLYTNEVYRRLVDYVGLTNVYVLSAGWGLIRADFLTPSYDITFSTSALPYQRRRQSDRYDDCQMLPANSGSDIVFFGGRSYLPLFCRLTKNVRAKRTVFFNSASAPQPSGCTFRHFETAKKINWHYECANAFLNGTLRI
jgi:hypothetical protein